jgi:hypothetical protein
MPSSPLIPIHTAPTKAAQQFLGSALVDAFYEAFTSTDDITMDGDGIEDVSNNTFFRYVVSDIVVLFGLRSSIVNF